MPGAGIEPARLAAGDFESPASTNFTTRAVCSEGADYGTGVCASLAWALPSVRLTKSTPIGAAKNQYLNVYSGAEAKADACIALQGRFRFRLLQDDSVECPHGIARTGLPPC